MYDIAIIGGGPSGSTLARLIGKKFKVLLLEKRSFSSVNAANEKCCGGLIAPDAQKMLASFGLGIPKSVLLSPQLFAVRTIDIDNSIERYYQRHYINIDREEFDKWLESIVPAEVNVINGCVYKSFDKTGSGVTIRFNHNGKDYEEKAKLLVGADGAFSKVRRQAFPDFPSPKTYISIQEWIDTNENMNYYGAIFDNEITDFYSWTIPKENCLILGSALKPNNDAHLKFELLKSKLKKYGFEFNRCIKRNGAFIFRPEVINQICNGSEQIVLIGEAAGFISPSSAEGLSYAFRSSLALAKALGHGIEGYHEIFDKNLNPLKKNIMLKNFKSPGMYNNFLRKLIMKSGILSIDVESATGDGSLL